MATINPFKPTAGNTPPILIGRDQTLRDFSDGIDNGPGAPERLMRITGMRGTGKTVMLNELGRIAAKKGWRVIDETGSAGFVERILEAVQPKTRVKGLTAQPSVLGISAGKVELETASLSLRNSLSSAIKGHKGGLLITLDEVQDASLEETRALAVAVQHLIREDQNIAFVFAGLPSVVENVVNGKTLTFLRRAVPVELGLVDIADVAEAYGSTLRQSGMKAASEVLSALAKASEGFPFMIQLVGYYAWQSAKHRNGEKATLDSTDVGQGVKRAHDRYGAMVIEPALQSLSPLQISYLLAMSEDIESASMTSNVAARLGKEAAGASPVRARLLTEDLIVAPARGKVAFAMPYMKDYLIEHREALLAELELALL